MSMKNKVARKLQNAGEDVTPQFNLPVGVNMGKSIISISCGAKRRISSMP